MLVTINSVIMAFKTSTFRATFQMSHLSIHSTNPNWEKATLRSTRIKDEAGKEVLTFKQITFGTMRIDADALYKCGEEEVKKYPFPLRPTKTVPFVILLCLTPDYFTLFNVRRFCSSRESLWVGKG